MTILKDFWRNKTRNLQFQNCIRRSCNGSRVWGSTIGHTSTVGGLFSVLVTFKTLTGK